MSQRLIPQLRGHWGRVTWRNTLELSRGLTAAPGLFPNVLPARAVGKIRGTDGAVPTVLLGLEGAKSSKSMMAQALFQDH